jgi:hypothetical protein
VGATATGATLLRDGYAVLDAFLDAGEVAALRPAVEKRIGAPAGAACERPHNTLLPLRFDDPVVDSALSSQLRRRRLREAAQAEDLRWISGYVSLKEAHTPALWWHQDWWCWDHPVSYSRAAAQVAVLCYLTHTDEGNAALRVLPGSHHAWTELHQHLPEAHATGNVPSSHPAMRDYDEQVTLRLQAGDAVVMDYRLLHGTHPNTTGERRDGVLLNFTPSWRGLTTDMRGHLIQQPGLPAPGEDPDTASWARELLPAHGGPVGDLPLNRHPPAGFAIPHE